MSKCPRCGGDTRVTLRGHVAAGWLYESEWTVEGCDRCGWRREKI